MTVSTACGRWPEELRFPPPVMKSKPSCVCPRSDGFDSGCSFLAARLNRLGERWKLVEPTCERQRAGRVETVVTVVGVWLSGVSGGFDSGRSFFAARLNQLGERWKLVEPPCSLCELGVSKPRCRCLGTCGRVWLPDAGWFRHSRSLALTCWLNRLRGRGNRLRPQASREFDEMPGLPSWTILPGFRLRPGSTPSNSVR